MKEEKIHFTVEKIEEGDRPAPGSAKTLKIRISSGGKNYKKVVRRSDYLNENTRKGLHELWMKGLRALKVEEEESEEQLKRDTEILASEIGKEIEDEEE